MKVAKPTKVPVLTRVVELARRPSLHVAAMLGFPIGQPRGLLDEMSFWAGVSAELGEAGVLDESTHKPRGEVLVAGRFHAPGGREVTAGAVRLGLWGTDGAPSGEARATRDDRTAQGRALLDKRLAVIGDRRWLDRKASEPVPFSTMPVDWAHAFGGPSDPRNPYGRGAAPVEEEGSLVHRLPNIEQLRAPVTSPRDRPPPAGLGAMDVTFASRRARAGTYDGSWLERYSPGLPPDAQASFANVAPEDQWIEGYFRGGESFVVENMHPELARTEGRVTDLFARAFVTQHTAEGERFHEIPLYRDTLWLFPGSGLAVLVLHGAAPVRDDDAADVTSLLVACEAPGTPRSLEHYQAALARRLDKDDLTAGLSDSDLMPDRTSGVAPNLGTTEIGQWVRSEGLHAKNLRRGQERIASETNAKLVALGLDPADYAVPVVPPEPEPLDLDDLDAVAAALEAQLAEMPPPQDVARRIQVERAKADEKARQIYEEWGEDYDEARAKAADALTGPPTFSAAAQLELMARVAADARADGLPLVPLEQALADPAYATRLQTQEAQLEELYRLGAHNRPPAPRLAPHEAARTRVIVQACLDGDESLVRRDLSGADLAGLSFAGLDLGAVWFEGADLRDCDFTGARLDNAVLTRAELTGATFRDASLRGANLGATDLSGADFEGADLETATIQGANLAGARLRGAKLPGVALISVDLTGCDLAGATLTDATFLKSTLDRGKLAGADLTKATFIECSLHGVDVRESNMTRASLIACKGDAVSFRGARLDKAIGVHGSSLPEADFRDADMTQLNLRGTVLRGARFDRAKLPGADLSEADLTGASLERADLQGALLIRTNLTQASLRGARLQDALLPKALLPGADFTGANLFQADLSRTLGDDATTFAEAETARVRYEPKAEQRPAVSVPPAGADGAKGAGR